MIEGRRRQLGPLPASNDAASPVPVLEREESLTGQRFAVEIDPVDPGRVIRELEASKQDLVSAPSADLVGDRSVERPLGTLTT